MNIQPEDLDEPLFQVKIPTGNSPKIAVGTVIIPTIMKIHRQAGNPFFPASDSSRPAWIQPPAILPSCPQQTNIAALVPSSDFLYHEPYIKCAPTLKLVSKE